MAYTEIESFYKRAEQLFGITRQEIESVSFSHSDTKIDWSIFSEYNGKLTIGFIASIPELAVQLVQDIVAMNRPNTDIVILDNTLSKLQRRLHNIITNDYTITVIPSGCDFKLDIAPARRLLFQIIQQRFSQPSVIWILDDDMRLTENYWESGFIKNRPIPINHIIGKYLAQKYDIVIGGYSGDAPVPLLSVLRLSLLDEWYRKNNRIEVNNERCTISTLTDYYYSISEDFTTHLESPILFDIPPFSPFEGNNLSRPLVNEQIVDTEPRGCGGNILIFNPKVLSVPITSLRINGTTARRGDFLWVLLCKERGFRIIQAPYSVLHVRKQKTFDYREEYNKLLFDLIGASMTAAFKTTGLNIRFTAFYEEFLKHLRKRMNRVVASLYRIQMLAQLCKYEEAILFSTEYIEYFINHIGEMTQYETIKVAFDTLVSDIRLSEKEQVVSSLKKSLAEKLHIEENSIIRVGIGSEGVVFRIGKTIYKLFYSSPDNLSFLIKMRDVFGTCRFLYLYDVDYCDGHAIIKYQCDTSSRLKGQINPEEMAELLRFSKDNSFVFKNLKRENFVSTPEGIKFIDYGKDIIPFSEETFNRSVERGFQLVRYPFLEEASFKELVNLSWQSRADAVNAELDLFKRIVDGPTWKEDILDPILLRTIRAKKPVTFLDYGAGKCKIANELAGEMNVFVYDIDRSTLHERASSQITIIDDLSKVHDGFYDLINISIVLCWLDNNKLNQVLSTIHRLLKPNGSLLITICSPFFSDVDKTQIRGKGREGSYSTSHFFQEYTRAGAPISFKEFHRPFSSYESLLSRNGFTIEKLEESNGIDTENILPIGEHLIIHCSKKERLLLSDTSLLIKCCAMDYRMIYRQINHIVGQIEKNVSFAERIVVVDCAEEKRTRRYDIDDQGKLRVELQRAMLNGLIDKVIWADDYIKHGLSHANNGQPLFATLLGLKSVRTPYVFQTDCDICYFNENGGFIELYETLKSSNAMTVSPSIAHRLSAPPVAGKRTEVRSCFLRVSEFLRLLPSFDSSEPWHRELDRHITPEGSLRAVSNCFCFIHPQNNLKSDTNFMETVMDSLERGYIPSIQFDDVDLTGNRKDWYLKTECPVVVYSRGKNTPPAKIKRMLDSLRRQVFNDYAVVYVDNASVDESNEYAKAMLRYGDHFKGHSVYIHNNQDLSEIENLHMAISNCMSGDCIIINIDNDDFLLTDDSISIINDKFKSGADITCGNCIKYTNPVKKWMVTGFDHIWNRDGDNIWLHPKCFKRSLFLSVPYEDMCDENGRIIDTCTDYAFMVPMIQKAKRPEFINSILYYFEPSLANITHQDKYDSKKVQYVKTYILLKAKERYEKDNSNYRR